MEALEFIKQRWYWFVGGLIGIWLVMKLLGSGSASTTSSATVPAGTAITYTGTNANDAAVQVAQLQNQSSLAGAQIAAAQAAQLATIAEHATESTNNANVSIAGITTSGNVSIAGINAGTAMHTSDNATMLGIVQSNNGKAVSITQANDAYLLGLDTNATNLKALVNTNATQLAGYGLQTQVANNQISALQNIAIATSNNATKVQTTYLNDATTLQSQYLNTQQSNLNSVLAEVNRSGGFNSQHGGANSTAAVAAVLNPSQAAVASLGASAASVSTDAPQNVAAIINSIGTAVKGGLSAVFA